MQYLSPCTLGLYFFGSHKSESAFAFGGGGGGGGVGGGGGGGAGESSSTGDKSTYTPFWKTTKRGRKSRVVVSDMIHTCNDGIVLFASYI